MTIHIPDPIQGPPPASAVIAPNTRVRIQSLTGPNFEAEWKETGRTYKPRASQREGVPSPEWSLVRFDDDGGRLCIHNSQLMVCNDQRRES